MNIFLNIVLVFNIIKHLDIDDIFKCQVICKDWNKVVNNNKLWEILISKKLFNIIDFLDEETDIYGKYGRFKESSNFKHLYKEIFKFHYNRFRNYNILKNKNIIIIDAYSRMTSTLSNFEITNNKRKEEEEDIGEIVDKEYGKFWELSNSILNSYKFNNSYEFGKNNKCRLFILSKNNTQSSFPGKDEIKNTTDLEFLLFIPSEIEIGRKESNYEYSRIIRIGYTYSIDKSIGINQIDNGIIRMGDFESSFEILNLDDALANFKEIEYFDEPGINKSFIDTSDIGFTDIQSEIVLSSNIFNEYNKLFRNTFSIYSNNKNNNNNNQQKNESGDIDLYEEYLSPLFTNNIDPISKFISGSCNNKSNKIKQLLNVKWKLTFFRNILKNKPVEFMFYAIDDTLPIHYNEYSDPKEWYENDKVQLKNLIEISTIEHYYHNYSFCNNRKAVEYKLEISIPSSSFFSNSSMIKLYVEYNSLKSLFSIHYSSDSENKIIALYKNIDGIQEYCTSLLGNTDNDNLSLMKLVSLLFEKKLPQFKFKLHSLLVIANLDQFMSFQHHNNHHHKSSKRNKPTKTINPRIILPLQSNEDLEHMYGYDLDFNINK